MTRIYETYKYVGNRERTRNSTCAREANIRTRVEAGEMEAILIIEDNDLLRHAVATMLRREGYPVLEAADGTSALALFKEHEAQIGFVILDMILPDMSGRDVFETIERLRPGLKVVITSAYSHQIIETAMDGGQPWVFVQKPYRVYDVLALIRIASDGKD